MNMEKEKQTNKSIFHFARPLQTKTKTKTEKTGFHFEFDMRAKFKSLFNFILVPSLHAAKG